MLGDFGTRRRATSPACMSDGMREQLINVWNKEPLRMNEFEE